MLPMIADVDSKVNACHRCSVEVDVLVAIYCISGTCTITKMRVR